MGEALPLDGLRIIEMSTVVMGPFAAQILGVIIFGVSVHTT